MHYDHSRENNYTSVFAILSVLFFMWGLVTVTSGFLVPELMNVFGLNYYEKIIISASFFGTYLFASYPAGILIDRFGFKNGIIIGVLIASVGCILFYVAALNVSYNLSIVSLFVLASGITILQVGANSYVVLVGKRGRGARRLTFVQGFNALGAVVAALFALKVVGNGSLDDVEIASMEPESIKFAYAKVVQIPYLSFGTIFLIIAAIFGFANLPLVETKDVEPLIKEKISPRKLIWEFPHVWIGCLALFAYIGAEVTFFQFLLNNKTIAINKEIFSLSEKIDKMILVYWGGMMVGRFAGAALLSVISPRKMMMIASLGICAMVILFIIAVPSDGINDWTTALWIIANTGLLNSILFPCIFTMSMDGLGKFSEEASSVLIMSVGGGAIIPYLVFSLITQDPLSVKLAFVLILIAYLFIVFFGFKGSRYEKRNKSINIS